jgi:hypothetical protein
MGGTDGGHVSGQSTAENQDIGFGMILLLIAPPGSSLYPA